MGNRKKILLPEGDEPRTVQAASQIAKEGIADVILLGNEESIRKAAGKADLTGVQIIDPEKSDKLQEFANQFYEPTGFGIFNNSEYFFWDTD